MVVNGWVERKAGVRVSATIGGIIVSSVFMHIANMNYRRVVALLVQLGDVSHLLVDTVGLHRRVRHAWLAARHWPLLQLRLGADNCQQGMAITCRW